jgi:hypothetical protein
MDIHIDNKLGQLPYEKIYVKRAPMTLLGDWLPTSPLARLPACTFWVIGCLCMLLAWLPTCNPTARAKLAGNTGIGRFRASGGPGSLESAVSSLMILLTHD